MSANYWVDPVVFLLDTLLGLYIFALLLRFLFQWVGADFYNPISQFLIKITHPLLRPIRRIIPSIGRADSASLVLMFGLQMLGGFLIFLFKGKTISLAALCVWTVSELIELVFSFYFFAIIIRVLLSWLGTGVYSPAVSLLYGLTEPLLRASRRLLPPMGGIDLSPLIPLIAIQLGRMLVLPPLQQIEILIN